jgi:hypothetical protein
MLWKLVDVLAIIGALALLIVAGPSVIGASKWKKRLFRRRDEAQ